MSPWLSVWFSPRGTIDRVLATDRRRGVFLLWGLSGISVFFIQLIFNGYAPLLTDWRIVAAMILIAAALAIASLLIVPFFFRWSSRIFGGRAGVAELRAVLAWGGAPVAVGLSIALIVFFGLSSIGRSDELVLGAIALLTIILYLWSYISTILMYARAQGFGFWRAIGGAAVGWLFSISAALLFAVVIRTFLFQPFSIPSGSMMPTLLPGDYIFVSKYSYGYTRYSLPFSPRLFSGRLFASEPERGDVVVYRLPRDDSVDYVHRLVGLPGDRIQMIQGVLNING